MKKITFLLVIGIIMGLCNQAIGAYTETLISREFIGGGTAKNWRADDSVWSYTLPFSFPFYGTNYSTVYVSSNGYINFTSSISDYSNSSSELMSRVQIAPLWDDLRTDSANCDIYIHQPTSTSVCIRWKAVTYSDGASTEFEIVLYSNGNIKFNYGTTSNTLSPTVGISKGDSVNYLLSTYNGRTSLNNVQTSFISSQPPNIPPIATISASPTTGNAPLNVRFTGSGSDPDGTIVSYRWDFGDGTTATTQNPTHTYNNPGNYVVRLTVTDNGGATGSTTVNITVQAAPPPPPIEIPHLMRFQGKLEGSGGTPLDGSFTLTFRIYDTDVGGTPLWTEVQRGVTVEDGLLDVELGSVTELDLPFDKQYWLGVEVESDREMSPRFKLTTVPYSFRSAQ